MLISNKYSIKIHTMSYNMQIQVENIPLLHKYLLIQFKFCKPAEAKS